MSKQKDNSQQIKPSECETFAGSKSQGDPNNQQAMMKDKSVDTNIPENIIEEVLIEVSKRTGMKLSPKWKKEDKSLLDLIIKIAIQKALTQIEDLKKEIQFKEDRISDLMVERDLGKWKEQEKAKWKKDD